MCFNLQREDGRETMCLNDTAIKSNIQVKMTDLENTEVTLYPKE